MKTKVTISLSTGKEYETEVEDYVAETVAELIKNATNGVIAIGDVVVNPTWIMAVVPVPVEVTE